MANSDDQECTSSQNSCLLESSPVEDTDPPDIRHLALGIPSQRAKLAKDSIKNRTHHYKNWSAVKRLSSGIEYAYVQS